MYGNYKIVYLYYTIMYLTKKIDVITSKSAFGKPIGSSLICFT